MIHISRKTLKVDLYIVTFNSPPQLRLLLDSIALANPELLKLESKTLIDNSIDLTTIEAYDKIALDYGFEVIRQGNMGITGSRYWAAKRFDQSDSDYMVWFEDDMLLVADETKVCRNGLNCYVPNWLRKCISIIKDESLDLIKISFTEFWGDHHQQWAWHNLASDEERSQYFSSADHPMIWHRSATFSGLSYLIGEVYYCNWPSVITKAGNRKLFIDPKFEAPPFEQDVMRESFIQIRAGKFKSAVLMASLVNHNRVYHYNGDIRKEM